jgi:hypothetical protein
MLHPYLLLTPGAADAGQERDVQYRLVFWPMTPESVRTQASPNSRRQIPKFVRKFGEIFGRADSGLHPFKIIVSACP